MTEKELSKYVEVFVERTNAEVKDAFIDSLDVITFVVEPGYIGQSVGKGGHIVAELEEMFGRRVRVAEYSKNVFELIKSFVAPLKIICLESDDDGRIYLEAKDKKTTGLLIGKKARNLRNLERMVRRYVHVEEILVETNPKGDQHGE